MANYTILLIDYEPRSIERFREPLVGAGYAIEIATDGVSGIEAFHRLNPDMVLVEAMIPKKHGFEVCQELKRTPHGRKTPVIITTGVYKGRKYRTQALHIYGCDEYIEKPIAPEQLLELVGKFLKPGPSGSPPKSTERGPGESSSGGTPPAHDTSGSHAKTVASKAMVSPRALADSETEDEISAHLDAILWGTSAATPDTFAGLRTNLAAAVDPLAVVPPEIDATPEEDDPFAEIRAELNAELGALPDALGLGADPLESVPDFFPSDQLPPPSILEALPIPELELPSPQAELPVPPRELPVPPVDPLIADAVQPVPEAAFPMPLLSEPPPVIPGERPGRVVDFDTKRSRKNKKPKRSNARSSQTEPSRAAQPIPLLLPEERPAPRALEPAASVAELTLPRGTVVESELEAPVASRGMPVWVWAVAGIIAVVGVYFIFSRDMPDRSIASSPTTAPSEPVVGAASPRPAPEVAEPQASPQQASAPKTEVAEPQAPPEQAAPQQASAPTTKAAEPPTASVTQTQPPPAPKKQAERPIKPPVAAAPAVPASAARTDPRPKSSLPKNEPPPAATVSTWRAEPRPTNNPPKTEPPATNHAPAAPAGLEDSVAGVETLPDPADAPPTSKIEAGALIPIDEADTMPKSLVRRPPAYSAQARQSRASGSVVLNVLINERGTVDQVVLVIGAPSSDLNDAAIRAAKTWTYRPATKNGVPVKVWKSEQIVFKR